MLKNGALWISQNRFVAFIIYGIINTVCTYVLYLFFLTMMHYQLAYFLSYTLGIALAYLLNVKFVFKAKGTFKKAAAYPLIYVIQYLVGAFISYILVDFFSVPPQWALLFVIGILIPISYFLNKFFLRI